MDLAVVVHQVTGGVEHDHRVVHQSRVAGGLEHASNDGHPIGASEIGQPGHERPIERLGHRTQRRTRISEVVHEGFRKYDEVRPAGSCPTDETTDLGHVGRFVGRRRCLHHRCSHEA